MVLMMVERVVVRRRRARVEARLEVPGVEVPLRLRRLRRRPVVLGDVDLEALTGGVVLVAVDALEGPVVVHVVELVLAAVHVRLQVPLHDIVSLRSQYNCPSAAPLTIALQCDDLILKISV